MKKPYIAKYSGIIIGSAYGLFLRLIFAVHFSANFSFTDLFSITFIWIVPVFIGLTPILFASSKQLRSELYRCFTPLLTILLFFIFCFATRIEDLLCIVIIALPFMLGGMIGGFLFGMLILYLRKKKGVFYSILLIPFLVGTIEGQFKIPSKIYMVKNTVVINNNPDVIWKNIIRVKNINDNEFSKGFFNYAGIPRPIYAELDKDGIGAKRIGHFEDGLIFKETVNEWDLNKKVSFNIQVIPSSIRETVFDQHILKGDHFKFIEASYQLSRIDNKKTLLTLSSSYRLNTNINYYASFCGNMMLSDFQKRLLDVIKNRCED